jgi:hypothetical protein
LIIAPFLKQGTPVNIIVGSHVWVEDPTLAWIDGEVVSINNNEVHVQSSNGKKVLFAISHAFCIMSYLHPAMNVNSFFSSIFFIILNLF